MYQSTFSDEDLPGNLHEIPPPPKWIASSRSFLRCFARRSWLAWFLVHTSPCRIFDSIGVKQTPPKLNNNEGVTMIAESADITMPEAFLEYEGVKVYRTYQFDDPSTYPPSAHIFTTSPDGAYSTDPFRFDIRNLTVPAASADEDSVRAGEETAIAAVLEQAIDRGMISTPDSSSASRPVQVHQHAW
jgi:hypothetical protein